MSSSRGRFGGQVQGRPARRAPALAVAAIVGSVVGVLALLGAPAARADDAAWFGIVLGRAPGPGVPVLYPIDGGPAEAAGILAGDRIVRIDRTEIDSAEDLGELLASRKPGDDLAVVVRRGAAERTVHVRLSARGARIERPVWGVAPVLPRFRLGFTAATITPELRRHYGAPAERGVLITAVETDSTASRLGLTVGDVVIDVGGRPIRSAPELQSALSLWATGRPVEIGIVRGGQARTLTATTEAVVPPARPVPAPAAAPLVIGAPRALTAAERRALVARLLAEIDRLESRARELRERVRRLEADSAHAQEDP